MVNHSALEKLAYTQESVTVFTVQWVNTYKKKIEKEEKKNLVFSDVVKASGERSNVWLSLKNVQGLGV